MTEELDAYYPRRPDYEDDRSYYDAIRVWAEGGDYRKLREGMTDAAKARFQESEDEA